MFRRLLFPVVAVSLCLATSSASPRADTPAATDEAVQRYVPLLKDSDPLVRKRAALALKRLGTKAKSAIAALEDALTDKDAEVRTAVAAALEAIDPTGQPVREISVPPIRRTTEPPPAAPLDAKPLTGRPASEGRLPLGRYYQGAKRPPSILVARTTGEDHWRRLQPGTVVFTGDRLVSLPGYASEIRLENGLRLLLRGHLREFSLFPEMDYLQECAILLHPGEGVDTDLTLERGRLFLSNHGDKVRQVRLRFAGQVWGLTLQPEAEVVLDLLKRYRGDVQYREGEEPVATLHLMVLRGNAGLAAERRQYPELSAPPGPAYFTWDNKGGGLRGPVKVEKVPPFFGKILPVDPANREGEKMDLALQQLSKRMVADREPAVVLQEVLQNNDLPQHMLAIYCLGALDDVKTLLAILADPDPIHAPDRDTAIFTLRRWLGRDARRGLLLFDEQHQTGLLLADNKYTPREAQTIFTLLHDFSEEERGNPETYELLANRLLSDKVAIAELARWHLWRLSRASGVKLPSLYEFNAAVPRDAAQRQNAAREVKQKIREGILPPR